MIVLNVAEKPSMARQISQLLCGSESVESTSGKNKYCRNYSFPYVLNGVPVEMVMTSVLGHVKSLDFGRECSDWQRVPFEHLFVAPVAYEVVGNMADVADNLRSQARRCARLIIWTDCDREGEYIGSEIVQICTQVNGRLDVYRARYSVLTRHEMDRVMRNLSRLDERQVAAAEVRSELDLRAGAAFTRLQTLSFRPHFADLKDRVISYGSCQFPTLGFVVEQYLRISRFVPEDFWAIQLDLRAATSHEAAGYGATAHIDNASHHSGQGGDTKCTRFVWKRGRIYDRLVCAILYERCVQLGRATITKVESRPTTKWRPIPLRTVEFQKFGSRYLKIPSDALMEIAERLYNGGYISYPRTETDQFDDAFDLRPLISLQCGHPKWGSYARKLLASPSGGGEGCTFRRPRKGKNNDNAHPPIHPTGAGCDLEGRDLRVYEFVTRRFLACCSDDAKGSETTAIALIGDEEFRARGIVVHALNYLEVYTYETWSDVAIGNFELYGQYTPERLEMIDGRTTAPKLLSEAELIGTMDKNGIGTDATIHEHIKKILERSYAVKNGEGRFHPTNLGVSLVLGYDQMSMEESLTQPCLRALLEANLKAICDGTKSKASVAATMIALFKRALLLTIDKMASLLETLSANRHGNLLAPAPLQGTPEPTFALAAPRAASQRRGGSQGPPGGGPLGHDHSENDEDGDEFGGNRGRARGRGGGPPSSRGGAKTKRGGSTQKRTSKRSSGTSEGGGAGHDSMLHGAGSSDRVLCHCRRDAVDRCVSKEGPNKGRWFYCCPLGQDEPSRCDFFQWQAPSAGAEPRAASSSSALSPSAAAGRAGPFGGSGGGVNLSRFASGTRCPCGLEATRLECKNGPNSGRYYIQCSKVVYRCAFFAWEDGQPSNGTDKDSQPKAKQRRATEGPPKSSRPAARSDVRCYRCGDGGHYANACDAAAPGGGGEAVPEGGRGRLAGGRSSKKAATGGKARAAPREGKRAKP